MNEQGIARQLQPEEQANYQAEAQQAVSANLRVVQGVAVANSAEVVPITPDAQKETIISESDKPLARSIGFWKLDSVDDLLEKAKREYPLLEPEDEVRLGRELAAAEAVRKNYHQMSLEQIDKALPIVKQGLAARDKFIGSNIRLVASIAPKYLGHPKGKEYGKNDLVSEGMLGLIHAVEKFDPEKGIKLSTYATYWIRHAVQRALQNKGSTIRVSVNMDTPIRRLSEMESTGKNDAEIQANLKLSPQALTDLRHARTIRDNVSLDESINPNGEGEELTRGALIADPNGEIAFSEIFEDQPTSDQEILSDSGADATTFPDELADSPLLETLKPFLDERGLRVLAKQAQGEELDDVDVRYNTRLKSLFEHPAVRARIQKFHPRSETVEADWRDEAGCIDKPEIFIMSLEEFAKSQPELSQRVTNQRDARKRFAVATCEECKVQQNCKLYFETRRPSQGRWYYGRTS